MRRQSLAWVIIALGAVGLLIPFVGPLIGFGMSGSSTGSGMGKAMNGMAGMNHGGVQSAGSDGAFVITQTRILYHVLPGFAIIAGGLLLLGQTRRSHLVGAVLAVVGGAYMAAAPLFLEADTAGELARGFAYHWGTGLVATALAAFELGRRVGARSDAPNGTVGVPAATHGATHLSGASTSR